MNVWQSQWSAAEGLQPKQAAVETTAQLALLFGSRAALQDAASIASIRARFPSATMIGCSTAGEIPGTRIYDDTDAKCVLHHQAMTIASLRERP